MAEARPWYPRFLRPRVEEALADTPVVLIHGPRQCGKTTLAHDVGDAAGFGYVTFDDDAARAAAEADPIGFVNTLPERVVLDEVQRVPDLFTTLKGGPVSRHYVWEMVSRYARRAGIERPVWPHLLRHTYACDLLGEGFTIAEVQRLMRHADLRTTAIYLHVRDEDLAAKVRRRGQPPEAT